MPKLSPKALQELLDLLQDLPATADRKQRNALLFSLPPRITGQIDRSDGQLADLVNILTSLDSWGQLSDGRWAMEVLLFNAVRAARESASLAPKLEEIRAVFDLAVDARIPAAPENVASEVSYLMPAGFLPNGDRASAAVARLLVPRTQQGKPMMEGNVRAAGKGTGWLIAQDLLITAYHVIEARFFGEAPAAEADVCQQAAEAEAWFDYRDDQVPHHTYRVERLEALNPALDFALLRLSREQVQPAEPKLDLSHWGFLTTVPPDYELRLGQALNIVQHPGGEPKQIAIRRNDYVGPGDRPSRFLYLTDTRSGSSGAPVCDDTWRVVGLHRAANRVPEKAYQGERVRYNNEGVFMRSILASLSPEMRAKIPSG